ncbi:MAG TPA: transporter [Candidatus Dormibacteraeota bacterium]|nr:transporter [Candidatus Dormibacteraeota bacterium]
MSTLRCASLSLTLLALAAPAASALAAAPLETETARFPARGVFEADVVLEVQQSGDGRESALPLAFEYGVTDRLTLMAEPVPFTRIHPKSAPGATGIGDLEVTLSGLLLPETHGRPAFALAGEVKVPTAESMLIGSDQYDYAGYLIASKRFSKLDAHVNLGYTIVGHPAGIAVENTLNYAIAGEYTLAPRWTLVGEFLGNTAAVSGEGASNEATATPEISGGEQIGMIGARYWLARRFVASLGVTVDNNGAVLVRPGIGARF